MSIGHARLANVMQQRAATDVHERLGVYSDLPGQAQHYGRDAIGVADCFVIA